MGRELVASLHLFQKLVRFGEQMQCIDVGHLHCTATSLHTQNWQHPTTACSCRTQVTFCHAEQHTLIKEPVFVKQVQNDNIACNQRTREHWVLELCCTGLQCIHRLLLKKLKPCSFCSFVAAPNDAGTAFSPAFRSET